MMFDIIDIVLYFLLLEVELLVSFDQISILVVLKGITNFLGLKLWVLIHNYSRHRVSSSMIIHESRISFHDYGMILSMVE